MQGFHKGEFFAQGARGIGGADVGRDVVDRAVVLGLGFTALQAYEYSHAAFGLSGNIYGANFFMATGFHGAHVIIGTIFLAVCLARTLKGHFTPESHVGFEMAAWYWHFVDVVWLGLFVFVYVY